jgi:P-type Cu+ transporter
MHKPQRFFVQGMSCASCAGQIEATAKKHPAIERAIVNFATQTASLTFRDPDEEDELLQILEKQGFTLSRAAVANEDDEKILFRKFLGSFILSLGLFWFAMGPGMHNPHGEPNWWIQAALATPIWWWLGLPFVRAVWIFARTGHATMFTLIGLGTGAAYFYSLFITIFYDFAQTLSAEQNVYFEAVGFIIAFVYLGQWLETKAKKRAKESLESLLSLASKEALVKKENGEQVLVALKDLQKGDFVIVKPGEKIPVDGIITEGTSSLDESLMTGEPIPRSVVTGDSVIGGTFNGEGRLLIQTDKIGSDTFLSQMISFVEEAQLSKPSIQRYADKIAAVFVPIVVVIAIVSFFIWFFFGPEPRLMNALSTFIAVLVIACPCALGLATPTAVVVATARAAREGLLIAGGEAIEKASAVTTIVFDKTGTLTMGKPQVSKVDWFIESDRQARVLQDVCSLEEYSEHPLARGIVDYAHLHKISLQDPDAFEILPGLGLQGEISGRRYLIGSLKLMQEKLPSAELSQFAGSGTESLILVSDHQTLLGVFYLSDQIKEHSFDLIKKLQEMGVKTVLMSGDRQASVLAVKEELGLDEAYYELLPNQKAEHIREMTKSGLKVAMIGDGLNDAPALSEAYLSLAMGTGSDVAIEASDVTVLGGDIAKVADFFTLSIEAMRVIRQNLFLSFVYNTLCIPLAAGLFYPILGWLMPPMMASIAMGASSLSVLGNSLRLKWKLNRHYTKQRVLQ